MGQMKIRQTLRTPVLTTLASASVVLLLGGYFSFAALQGENGIFRRIQINDEALRLQRELDALNAEIAEMQNITRRLSDSYLDLDLLDEQARKVLGYIRSDEIVIH